MSATLRYLSCARRIRFLAPLGITKREVGMTEIDDNLFELQFTQTPSIHVASLDYPSLKDMDMG